jgi:glycosyltransferase involved in cell wall biosynthesis
LNRQLADYTHFIGSGVAPALFHTLGRRLDVFAPYGMGIELYGHIEFMHRRQESPVRYLSRRIVRHYQAKGIRETRHCLNAEMSLTKDSFEAIGKPFERLAYPMLYNRESMPAQPPAHLAETIARLRGSELSMFCCARLLWVPDPTIEAGAWRSQTKNSDWMFRGLARFLQQQPSARVLLAVVQYGPDVEASQRLVHELGLDGHVLWLPKMARRELMLLLDAAHIGIGEFYRDPGVIWGGTGWETLAAGRPLMQSFNFTAAGFETEFGHPPPPILDVTSADDVARHIAQMHADPAARQRIGETSLAWFNRHNGIGMAERWLQRATGPGGA